MSRALADVAAVVRRQTGMVIKEAQFPALEAALRRVAPELGPVGFLGAVEGGGPGGGLLSRLIDEVTVQETYFFRELRELQAIDWRQLLDKARETGAATVRVWVAACATGEEAYSLAILASESLGGDGTPVTILATDVSVAALARAAAGDGYADRSVRNLSPELRDRYLEQEDGRYRVRSKLKSLVRFRHHNLVTDSSPPLGEVPFDVVACRNVLIYFDRPTVQAVRRALERSLRPQGHLILGAADRLTGTADALASVGAGPRELGRPRRPKRQLRRPLGLPPTAAEDRSPAGERRAPATGAGLRDGTAVNGQAQRRDDARIDEALAAADDGDLERALELVNALLADDELMADAYFIRGLVELERGDPGAAAGSLRRCLYIDPSFGLAAFELGRAQEARGDERAARRAYEQALRALDPDDGRHQAILDQVDLGDVAAACAVRLGGAGGAR
ncbi:MAG TPA: CheR family methyltransferase [Solirubrobacteraceae bacterium]|nr:CheR family methyltransferase [Solirubrobacteraceae bacterium]